MSAKVLIRALPNVEFVHGFPGIPAGPDRPQATIRGAVEIRLGNQPVKAKWVKVELRKIETIPSGNRGEEFVDLVGQNPITVWEAQDEHEMLSSKDFPFNIRVPETIPPSVALKRGAGIKYEVVATLSTKGKKGLFRRDISNPISHSVPVVIDKHELHSTWPIYSQPESRHVVSNGLTLVVDRSHTCFAPGDRLSVLATLKSDNLSPVVLRGFEFSLRETVIYRAGPQSHGKKNGPLIQTSVLGEQKLPVSITLYGGTQHKAELGCVIPGTHTTSSVNAGRHIDIAYSLNIKANIDMANPVVMDLPVTITNWPRQVSADMIRRIGTAPNLSLTAAASPKPIPTTVVRPKYGPPRPPPSGSLPSLPNGSGPHSSVPQGALVNGPPGSHNLALSSTSLNLHSFQQMSYSTTAGETPQQQNPAPAPEVAITAASNGASAANNFGSPDEFGYYVGATTAPSRQGENHDFDVTDARQSPSSINHRPTESQSSIGLDNSGSNRMSQYSQDQDIRATASTNPQATTGRRSRGMSRTLKIMNADDDIPEEESPGRKEASLKLFDSPPATQLSNIRPTSPPDSFSSASPWPTSDEEKKRLYEAAKAKAQKVQAFAKAASESPSQAPSTPPSTRPSNGHVSPPRQVNSISVDQTANGDRPRTTSPTPSRAPWLTAEEEKQRLFERAQAKVRRIQGMAHTSSPSTSATNTASGSIARPSHSRTTSSNSSQESHSPRGLAAYTSTSVPTISAGAALYSHAMASINRSTSANSYAPPTNAPAPRRNMSYASPSTTMPNRDILPPTRPVVSPDGNGGALRYYEARSAVQQQQAGGTIPEGSPQEGPIPYHELFGTRSGAAPAPASNANGVSPHLSENEVAYRAFEAPNAQTGPVAGHTPPLASIPPTVPVQRSPSVQPVPPSVQSVPPLAGVSTGMSEKEILRRAFEARDVAMMRSGQAPPLVTIPPPTPSPVHPPLHPLPPAMPPVQPPPPAMSPMQCPLPARSPSLSSGPSSSTGYLPTTAPLSEKEQMRRAFEARDRAIAAQQTPPPPDYDSPPPSLPPGPPASGPAPSDWNESNSGPMSAAEEKAQLKAHHAAADASTAFQFPPSNDDSRTPPQPDLFDSPESPTRAQSHKSHKSDGSDYFLRRDPTISAGKKRASQMIAPSPPTPPLPPPLPPRPPEEYIEVTKREDKRHTLEASVALPPSDFSSSFDLGFSSFSTDLTPSEHPSG